MLIHHHLSNREPAGLLSDTGGPEPAPRQAGGADGEAGAGGFRMGDAHACGWFTLMCGKNLKNKKGDVEMDVTEREVATRKPRGPGL